MNEFPKKPSLSALISPPCQQARQYLLMKGVAYNDLITGDHACFLLAQWTREMTDWFDKKEK